MSVAESDVSKCRNIFNLMMHFGLFMFDKLFSIAFTCPFLTIARRMSHVFMKLVDNTKLNDEHNVNKKKKSFKAMKLFHTHYFTPLGTPYSSSGIISEYDTNYTRTIPFSLD